MVNKMSEANIKAFFDAMAVILSRKYDTDIKATVRRKKDGKVLTK